jgi:hypothetical protein
MKRIADTWAEIGRTMVRDLREILNSDLSPTMKEGIAALPPEMRHAWAEGNKAQRAAIEDSLRDTYSLENTIARLVNDARAGGHRVGASMVDGLRDSIAQHTGEVSQQAAFMVRDAIAAARAAAQAESPSKRMIELGRDLVQGLKIGVEVEGRKDPLNMMPFSKLPQLDAGGTQGDIVIEIDGETVARVNRRHDRRYGRRNATTGS